MKRMFSSLIMLLIAIAFINISLLSLGYYANVPFFAGPSLYFRQRGYNYALTSFFHLAAVFFIYSVRIGFFKESKKSIKKRKFKFLGLLLIALLFTIVGFIFKSTALVSFILSGSFTIASIIFVVLTNMDIINFDLFGKQSSRKTKNNVRNENVSRPESNNIVSNNTLDDDEDEYDEVVDLKEAQASDTSAIQKSNDSNLQVNRSSNTKTNFDVKIDNSVKENIIDFDKLKEEEPQVAQEDYTELKSAQTIPRIVRVKEEKEEEDLFHGVANLQGQTKGVHRWQYSKPSVDLLVEHKSKSPQMTDEELIQMQNTLVQALDSYSIKAEADGYTIGPTVALFKLKLATGVPVKRVISVCDDIARLLGVSSSSLRVIPTIPGTKDIGIEVPNKNRQVVSFKNLAYSLSGTKGGQLPFMLGQSITGQTICIDIAKTPHLLIAGATGSGKSVCTNTLIASLIYTKSPNDVRLIMVDPKVVELQIYNDIPHLLTPIITDPKRAIMALDFCVEEMERRYRMLETVNVRNIINYNVKLIEKRMNREKMPYIVVVIDEFADLMTTVGKDLKLRISRLAAKARAVGIHLVLATQRPSVDIVDGTIKNNLPSRIAFRVPSNVDSKTILDCIGAEKLLGNGDMLYKSADSQDCLRIQGGFLSDDEVESIVEYVKTQGQPMYINESFFEDEIEADSAWGDDEIHWENRLDEAKAKWNDRDEDLLNAAWEVSASRGGVSTSYIQRTLRIGFNAAARIVDEMTARGIAGPANGAKPRTLLKQRSDTQSTEE